MVWRIKDIELASAGDLQGRALACFPPYSLLPSILELAKGEPDAMLMVPPRELAALLAQGWRLLGAMDGKDFEPASRGVHFIVAKGFAPSL